MATQVGFKPLFTSRLLGHELLPATEHPKISEHLEEGSNAAQKHVGMIWSPRGLFPGLQAL